jgi:hypothetical protein
MWSLLDLAPLAGVLVVIVLSAATLISVLVRAMLPDPRPNLRLIAGGSEPATPSSERRLRVV